MLNLIKKAQWHSLYAVIIEVNYFSHTVQFVCKEHLSSGHALDGQVAELRYATVTFGKPYVLMCKRQDRISMK